MTNMNDTFYFKVGDLVKKRYTRSYDDPEYPNLNEPPLIGVVVQVSTADNWDLWGGRSDEAFDMVKVVWNNEYGSFWTSTTRLILLARGHNDGRNKTEQK